MKSLHEKKPFKNRDGSKGEAHYYPGTTLSFYTVRDPGPKMVKAFFPAIIL